MFQFGAASAAKTEADADAVRRRCYDPETGIALRIDLRIFLSGLIQSRRFEVFQYLGRTVLCNGHQMRHCCG